MSYVKKTILFVLLITVNMHAAESAQEIARQLVHAPLPFQDRHYESEVSSVALSPDGTKLVTVFAIGTRAPITWSVATGSSLFQLPGVANQTTSASFSASGGQLLTVSTNAAYVWSAVDGHLLYGPIAHNAALITAAAISPDGQRLVMAGRDGRAAIWWLADRTRLQVLTPPGAGDDVMISAAFSPDGTQVLTVSRSYEGERVVGESASRWDAATGALLQNRDERVLPAANVSSLDRTKIATIVPNRRTVRIADRAPEILAEYFANPTVPLNQQSLLVLFKHLKVDHPRQRFNAGFLKKAVGEAFPDIVFAYQSLPEPIRRACEVYYNVDMTPAVRERPQEGAASKRRRLD